MRRAGLGLMLVIALSGTARADEPPTWEGLWTFAADRMKDPGSAYFRNAFYVVNRKAGKVNNVAFCASINAKNSYGAYGGFTPFIVSWIPGHGSTLWDESRGPILFGSLCGNEPPPGISPEVTPIPDMTQP